MKDTSIMKNEMLQKLEEALQLFTDIADQTEKWKSLYIDYEPPTVERVYTDLQNGTRLSLHIIHPCDEGEAFFHPHPWPSAMYLVSGSYRMEIGYGAGVVAPDIAATTILSSGSYYEMSHPDAWHSVQPLTEVHSVMISGPTWSREIPKTPEKRLNPLSEKRVEEIITEFKASLATRTALL